MRQNHARIALIRDRSGSMESIHIPTVGAYNEFINGQKQAPGTADVLLVAFDDKYDIVYDKPLSQVEPMGTNELQPRGSTALYDAVGRTIEEVGKKLSDTPEDQRPDKVIIVILSDGLNNASTRFSSAQIAEMIQHQREIYKWEFVFLGANQDAMLAAGQLNIPQHAALTYAASAGGVKNAMRAATRYTTNARVGVADAFNSADREDALTGDSKTKVHSS